MYLHLGKSTQPATRYAAESLLSDDVVTYSRPGTTAGEILGSGCGGGYNEGNENGYCIQLRADERMDRANVPKKHESQ